MNYFWLTLKHKWYVFLIGRITKVPLWRLIIHDWSKFTLSEYKHYQKQFFGSKDDPLGFAHAWIHLQNTNPHHWEYWIDRSTGTAWPMPDWAVREMVADWFAASKAYNREWPKSLDSWAWFNNNWVKISTNMHNQTIGRVLSTLNYIFKTRQKFPIDTEQKI